MNRFPTNATLYFLAIIPPEPVYSDAQCWKEHFSQTYHSKMACNSPPHITLHMPFQCKDQKKASLVDALRLTGKQNKSFALKINGFGAFAPRVIFMEVLENLFLNQLRESIHKVMKKKFHIFNANYRNYPFRPHITLAFRDLKKDKFENAWGEFVAKTYQEHFLVDKFWLLKHDHKRWQPHQSFSLNEDMDTLREQSERTTKYS